jgi:hypothetical protein
MCQIAFNPTSLTVRGWTVHDIDDVANDLLSEVIEAIFSSVHDQLLSCGVVLPVPQQRKMTYIRTDCSAIANAMMGRKMRGELCCGEVISSVKVTLPSKTRLVLVKTIVSGASKLHLQPP